MNELKQALDIVQNKKVITAYFNNPEDHEFLYFCVYTLANFAGLRFKEENGALFYTETDTEENWKPVVFESLESLDESLDDLIFNRTACKGMSVYFKTKDAAVEYFDWEAEYGLDPKEYDEIMRQLDELKL